MPETPTEDVLRLQKKGFGDAEVIASLTRRGYSPMQISEAINQAKIKTEVSDREGEAAAGSEAADMVPTPEGLKPSIMGSGKKSGEMSVPRPMVETQESEVSVDYPSYESAGETQAAAADTETIEEIAEEIVNEKLHESKRKIESISEWRGFADSKLKDLDDRTKRMEDALDRLQEALLGKVEEYGQNVKNIGSEMRDLEGAFTKMIPSLAKKSEKEKTKKRK